MTKRANERLTDLGLRGGGLALLGLAWLAWRTLLRVDAHGAGPQEIALLVAGAGFLATSIGAALTTLGAHVRDQITVSTRWASVAAERRP